MRLETPVLSLLDEQNLAKNVVHGEEAKSKVREETPGNPRKPFGNPFGNPLGNPWKPIRKQEQF